MTALARALSIAALLSGSAGCRAAPTTLSVGDEAAARGFDLAVGETASLSGGAITFVAIIRDERCPRGMKCEESGPVTARFRADAGPEIDLAILDRDRGEPELKGIRSCAPFAGRVLRLRDVKPWPAGSPVTAANYRVELVIASSCSLRGGN